jgi:hypothetical protein
MTFTTLGSLTAGLATRAYPVAASTLRANLGRQHSDLAGICQRFRREPHGMKNSR